MGISIQYLIYFKQSYYLRYCLNWNELKLVKSWLAMLEHVLVLSAYLFSIGIYNLEYGSKYGLGPDVPWTYTKCS